MRTIQEIAEQAKYDFKKLLEEAYSLGYQAGRETGIIEGRSAQGIEELRGRDRFIADLKLKYGETSVKE